MDSYTLAVTVIALALITAVPASSAEYFVSPEGSDQGPGTETQPWRTLAKANKTVEPGDTVNVAAGEYTDPISPDAEGREGAPITYRSTQRREATLVRDRKSVV